MTEHGPRRGRPMRLPTDGTAMRGMHTDSAPRISWLVATTRLYADDPAVHRRDVFAGALGAHGIRADQTRISRWESGSAHVPDKVIAGYDGALGFEPGHLLTVATGIRRALDPRAPAGTAAYPGIPEGGVEALLNRFREHGHTGLDWTRLTAAVDTAAGIDLPQQAWFDLCDQLLRELVRSTRFSWVRRYEAARALIRNPGSQRAMVRAIGALVTDPGAQAIEPVVGLLQEVVDPQVSDVLMRMLASPQGMLRRGAAWASAGRIARGYLDEDALDALTERLPRMLVRRDPLSLRADAVDLVSALPPERADMLIAPLNGNGPVSDLGDQVGWGELIAPDRSRRLADGIARVVEAALDADHHVESDQMLARLVRESLLHVHRERRHHASLLLSVSPYATELSRHLLAGLAGQENAVVARGLSLLAYLGAHEDSRGQLLTWSAHHPDLWLRRRAVIALAHLPGPLGAEVEHDLANLALTGPTRMRAAAMYALGRVGSRELERVCASGDPQEQETAAWWMRLGPPIDDEATHARALERS